MDLNFETTLFWSCLNYSWSFLLPLLCALLKRRFLFQINCTISLFSQGKLCLVGRSAFGIQESIMYRNELLWLDQVAWISFSTKISSNRGHKSCSLFRNWYACISLLSNKQKISGEHSNAAV